MYSNWYSNLLYIFTSYQKSPGAAAPGLGPLRGAEIRGRRGAGAARRGLRAELQAPRRRRRPGIRGGTSAFKGDNGWGGKTMGFPEKNEENADFELVF